MAYDAVAFLEGLFRQPAGHTPDDFLAGPALSPDLDLGIGPDDLPGDWRVDWEERAAILEYDGQLPRELAEARALTEVLGLMRRAGVWPNNHACTEPK
jgi:hypothetical protein